MNATEILIILSSVCFLLFTIRNLKINLCLKEYIFSLISMFPCQRVIFEILSFWDCTAWDYILFSKVFDVSEVFWNFILKSKLLCAQSRWRAKYQTEMQSRIAKLSSSGQKVKLQVEFPAKKNTPTVDTDDRTFNCNNADGHSQTGNCKKLASRIQKTGWRTEATRSALRLYTPSRIKLSFTQCSCYFGFDR